MTETVDMMRYRQRVRDAMRRYGLTEVFDGTFSKGDIVGKKMALVKCDPGHDADEATVLKSAEDAAREYAAAVKAKP